MAHSLLTIDVWDTILRRRCHPDEVKLFTARALLLSRWDLVRPEYRDATALLHLRQGCEHEIGQDARALGMDDEYRLADVMERWVGRAISADCGDEVERVARWASRIELAQEHEVTFADEKIHSLLAASNGARRVGLSDFYLPAADLSGLLGSKAPHLRLDEVVVSCDVGLNKRSGRLYRYIQDRTRIAPSQHAHIGDHADVDVGTPDRLGIRTVHYAPADHEARRAEHRRRWELRRQSPGSLVHALRHEISADVRAPERLTADEREMYFFGARCAPLYVGLVLRAMEEAIRVGAPRVHYFTREGEFFERVHDAIAASAPGSSLLGFALPGSELLEVSRLSTFCASIGEVTTREFMRIWNLYSTQSMGGMLASLDVPEISMRPLLELHGLDAETPITHPWLDGRVRALFSDRRFTGTIERARNQRKALLTAYLASRGFVDDGRAKVIVDIGWRGTIQDNLARVCPGSRIAGIYLGMHGVLNEQPANTIKFPYALNAAGDPYCAGVLLEHVQPLEVLSNSPLGSVRGYRRSGVSGAAEIEVERAADADETAMWENAARHFQKGVLAAVPTIARWIRDYAFSSAELRPMAVEAVRDIIAAPPEPICREFFRIRHNETFGLGGFVEMRQADPTELARRARTDAGAAHELLAAAGESRWPCAFYRAHGLEEERLRLAKLRYGHVPLVDVGATEPNHAAYSLWRIESSKVYRALRRVKASWPVRVVNRLRFGPNWDLPPLSEPVARLAAVRESRTFRVVRWLRNTGWARRRAIWKFGVEGLERW